MGGSGGTPNVGWRSDHVIMFCGGLMEVPASLLRFVSSVKLFSLTAVLETSQASHLR